MNGAVTLAWEAHEPERIRDLLSALGFRSKPGGRLTIPGLDLTIVQIDGPDRLGPAAGSGLAGAPEDQAGARTRLLAVGVATVDLERAAAASGRRLPALLPDSLLGARAAATDDSRVVLLEPATEGRLAATLARHGEGPAALYLAVGPAGVMAMADRLLALGEGPRFGSGPFGRQLLASTRHPSGPYLLVVARGPAPGAAGPADDAWATIEP